MGKIAIIINPNSGKDIRRLVTHATVIDNQEKVNIARRILAGLFSKDDHEVIMMPDRNNLAKRTLDDIDVPNIHEKVEILRMPVYDLQRDTLYFVKECVEKHNIDLIVVLGGDGTSRAAAKEIGNTILIPVSTGTNNVYPQMMEGTSVGLAAAAIASNIFDNEKMFTHGKRIEIQVGDKEPDIALIDAVFSSRAYIGARALLDEEDISHVFVTQCHPASIGFSSLAGSIEVIKPEDDYGMWMEMDWEKEDYLAPISAGAFVRFGTKEHKRVQVGETVKIIAKWDGTVGVDGEREIFVREGEEVSFTLTKNGPRKVDVYKTVEAAAKLGFFKL